MANRPFPSFLIYKDKIGEYRWRYQSSNTKIIADSGEGYKNKADCWNGINLVMDCTRQTPVWKTGDVED